MFIIILSEYTCKSLAKTWLKFLTETWLKLHGLIYFYPFFTQEEEKVSLEFLAGKVPEIVYQKAIQCIPGTWSV